MNGACHRYERFLNGHLSVGSKLWRHNGDNRLNFGPERTPQMNRNQQKLLIATLAGLIITGAAAFAIQPALAAGYNVDSPAQITGVKKWDVLNVRKWPASYSQKVGEFEPKTSVWVERCIIAPQGGSDWCLVEQQETRGWVNASFLTLAYDWDI